MTFSSQNKEEYADIPLLRMEDNQHGDLPFFIRKYSSENFGGKASLHRHEYMQINYIYKGKMKHIINKHCFDVIKGDIFVIPPYVPHCIEPFEGEEGEVFEFEFIPEFVNQSFEKMDNVESFLDFAYLEPFLVTESQVKPRLNLVGTIQVETEDIFNRVYREYQNKKAGYILLVKSLLLQLLVLVGREFTESIHKSNSNYLYERHRDAIYKAIAYMHEHCAENITIEEVVKVSLLSQSYFGYLFKAITSKTFVEYLNGLRISKAMELLKSTDKRILDICYDVGFRNVSHFNRFFRQKTGLTPLQYRKMK